MANEVDTVLRFGKEQFTGPAVDGIPMPEHPMWRAIYDQTNDDAHTVGLETETDYDARYEWARYRIAELVDQYTDLDATDDGVSEQIDQLAEVLANELAD